MKAKKSLLPAIMMALTISGGYSVNVHASNLNYSYVEGEALLLATGDEEELDKAFGIKGSFQVMEQVFVIASYRRASGEIEEKDTGPFGTVHKLKFDVDSDTFRVGGGYILPIASDWDVNIIAGFQKYDLSSNKAYVRTPAGTVVYNFEASDNALFLTGGVRGLITPSIEISSYLDYSKEKDESDVDFTVSGHYYIMDNLSVGATADIDGDGLNLMGNVRFLF